MSQRAVQKRLEEALTGEIRTTPSEEPLTKESQKTIPQSAMFLEMLSFSDLEDLLVTCCRNPENRVAVSHYVRWMSQNAQKWQPDEALLELIAILSISAERPRRPEGSMP